MQRGELYPLLSKISLQEMLNFCGKLIDAGNSYNEASLNQPTTLVLITVSFVQVTITDNNFHAQI